MDTPQEQKQSTPRILIELTRRGPIHLALIALAVLWLVPTVGLGFTSFRSRGDIAQSGWWTTVRGNRSTSPESLELIVDSDTFADGIIVSQTESTLLADSVEGYPNPEVGSVSVIEVIGQLQTTADALPFAIADVGTLEIADDDSATFKPTETYNGYFVTEAIERSGDDITIDYRLTGREQISDTIEIEEFNDGVRVPRTGTLTVLPDGTYEFERRSSFVGTFEATIAPEALETLPILVEYEIDRAGGIFLTADAGQPVELPLAGTLQVDNTGSYQFTPAENFTGTIVSEVNILNATFTLDNYRGVLEREDLPPPGFLDNLRNSFIITIPSTILPILLASFAAYAFAWMQFPFRDSLYLLIIAMLVVPLQTTWVPVLKVLDTIGINGTFAGIWITHTAYGLPFAIFLLYNFFRDLPKEVFEAARIDGANEIVVFFQIVLPLSMPAIASLGIFQFVWVWNDLMNALIFLDRDKAPLTIGIRNLLGQYGNEWHLLAAGAFISMIVPLVVFLAFQQYFVRGLTAGAVKG